MNQSSAPDPHVTSRCYPPYTVKTSLTCDSFAHVNYIIKNYRVTHNKCLFLTRFSLHRFSFNSLNSSLWGTKIFYRVQPQGTLSTPLARPLPLNFFLCSTSLSALGEFLMKITPFEAYECLAS